MPLMRLPGNADCLLAKKRLKYGIRGPSAFPLCLLLPVRSAPHARPLSQSGTGTRLVACQAMAHLEETLLPLVKNLLLLDAEGKRVAVKYFDETWCATWAAFAWLTSGA